MALHPRLGALFAMLLLCTSALSDELTLERFFGRACGLHADSVRLGDYRAFGFFHEARILLLDLQARLYGLEEDVDMIPEQRLSEWEKARQADRLIKLAKRAIVPE